MFKKKKKEIEYDETEKKVIEKPLSKAGVTIHFTPAAIYVYICDNEAAVTDPDSGSGLNFRDADGRYIGIDGNYVTVRLNSLSEVDSALERYGVNDIGLPVYRFDVKAFNFPFESL